MITESKSRAARTPADRAEAQAADVTAHHLCQDAFGGNPDSSPSGGLPSFRPLVRGVPVKDQTEATLHPSARSSHASSPGHAASPSRANVLMPSSRDEFARRRRSWRLWPVLLFLSGVGAGLGGGYGASIEIANNWKIDPARALLPVLSIVPWPETQDVEQAGGISYTLDDANDEARAAALGSIGKGAPSLTQVDPPAE